MPISYRKLNITLSADKETVLVFGQELSTKYFTEIVVTTMLNSTGSDMAKSNRILNDIHAIGLNASDYGKYSRWWAESNAQERQEAERRRKEAEEHQERMAAIHATPAEIAKAAAERRARDEDLIKRFGNKGASFGY
ncbi:hypothetical protein QNN86_12600 [Citrobacter sp. C348]|uniref:DUF6971 domain-containing protein n=1 Tax=Enterobacter asburiae TaxID=61645 RepID=A0A7W3C5M3_ENTAS|nr:MULTISPECIES: hypothetical protein [Enterobacteriaceae]MDU1182580.1 hypothetical protein [Citrobacter sp.]HBX7856163.1 hypothetical protein [Klebsiella pneumoniae]HBZ8959991.1 hypothetical protein [Citrobacter freundii]EFH2720550.1 hypothetical protein [Escherichia coli]MBA7984647.1 hypothetical protein [Enterobacter asburiae]